MVKLKQRLKSGIAIAQEGDAVPEYEAREACVYVNYSWLEFQTLDWQERASAVAQYRMHNLIEAHVSDASTKASEMHSARVSEHRQPRRR